ncbi:MAG: P-loop NTPase fold protein [Segatella copri]
MWNDIETTNDYLHFSVVSGTVADLIIESGDNPISIGVSGNWGSGKSSMVKMIGKELKKGRWKTEISVFGIQCVAVSGI